MSAFDDDDAMDQRALRQVMQRCNKPKVSNPPPIQQSRTAVMGSLDVELAKNDRYDSQHTQYVAPIKSERNLFVEEFAQSRGKKTKFIVAGRDSGSA